MKHIISKIKASLPSFPFLPSQGNYLRLLYTILMYILAFLLCGGWVIRSRHEMSIYGYFYVWLYYCFVFKFKIYTALPILFYNLF